MKTTTRALRKKLDNWKQKPIVAPGVHDPYCARIAEKLGFDTLYMGGAATSMSRLGMADFGLATATEVQANARYITSITDLPLIADSDNGYGNALNTMRTVKDYIGARVAGIHVEDQVIPKRCGHLKGKVVISLDEMVGKVKAAKKVIKEEDPDFVLIARTDARGAVGGGLDDAVKRLKAYQARRGRPCLRRRALIEEGARDDMQGDGRAYGLPSDRHLAASRGRGVPRDGSRAHDLPVRFDTRDVRRGLGLPRATEEGGHPSTGEVRARGSKATLSAT